MRWLTKLLMIKDEERSSMVYYVTIFVLIGVGLSLGRGSMGALFLKRYGIEYLPIMYAVLSVVMAVASLAYASYVDRIPSERMFVKMLGVLGILVAAIWGTMAFTNAEWVYPAYYLVYELASELVIVHTKLYVEQNFDSLQLQRLSAPMFASANIGKSVGGALLGVIVPIIQVSNVLLVWAALVAIPILLIVLRHRHVGISPFFVSGRKGRGVVKQSVEHVAQGLKFFQKTEMLRAASYALFFMVISFFILRYSVNRVLTETFPTEDKLAEFIGWISAVTGTVALLVQLLLTGRLMRRFGVKKVGLIFPSSAVLSFLALVVSFSLPAALIGIFSRDVIFPAVRKPSRMVFLHALPDYMMGRVNALSVGLVLPLALLATSGFLMLTQRLSEPTYFVVGGMCSSLIYLYFRMRANRAYTPALLATLSHRLFLPQRQGEDMLNAGNEELCKQLVRGVSGPDENMAVAYARMLTAVCPDDAPRTIAQRLPTASYPTRDRLLRLLIAGKLPVSDILYDSLADTDTRLKATILEALFDTRDPRAREYVDQCLHSDNPRLAATGIFGAYRYERAHLEPSVQETWQRLLSSPRDVENLAGLELMARIPDQRLVPQLRKLMENPSTRVRRAALKSLACFPQGSLADFAPVLRALYKTTDPELRALCVEGYRVLSAAERHQLCIEALEDEHNAVRDAALKLIEESEGRDRAVDIVKQWILENRGFPRAQQSALGALSRYRLPGEVFKRIAESKVHEASKLAHALRVIQSDYEANTRTDPVLELLAIVLQERVSQVLDLALMAMENFEDPATITAVRAGLATNDRRHIAHACEALHNLHDHTLTAPLIALVDNTGFEKRDANVAQEDTFQNAREVIAWCMHHPDAWLRECASRTAPASVAAGT
jgi:HEAT repeat protein